MTFKDNFSEILLISEQPVIFYATDQYLIENVHFAMTILSIACTLNDPYVQLILTIFNMPIIELQKHFAPLVFKTRYELFVSLLTQQNMVINSLHYVFNLCFGSAYNSNNFTIHGIEIDEELFNRIINILLISSGLMNYENQTAIAKKPQWLIEKEQEIQRIKNQNNNQISAHASFLELSKILIPLNYELGYSIEELFKMNYFHIHFLSKYIPKMIGYDVSKRQVFSKKKIKYITD